MARGSRPTAKSSSFLPERTFVLDNGGSSMKAGFAPEIVATDEDILKACEVVPNCIVRAADRKIYVAANTTSITQWSEAAFRRPIENGQLVNWECQKEIWDHSFFDKATASAQVYVQDPSATTLILTEAINTIPALQRHTDEIVMEEWGFGGYLRAAGPSLNAYNHFTEPSSTSDTSMVDSDVQQGPNECILIVDSGYSSTTVVPCFQGKPVHRAVRRMDFGGKHLTNHLKETISVRHFDLHQDTKIVNDIKEDTTLVSTDFTNDLARVWKGAERKTNINGTEDSSSLRIDYVLPDGVHLTRGYARPHDPSREAAKKRKQALISSEAVEVSMILGNERFTVPEIIFHPADIGSKQPGIVECIVQSLTKLPPLLQATMVANIVVVGGNANIPGFVERLQNDLRSQIRTEWFVKVRKAKDPTKSTWLGGVHLAYEHRDLLQRSAVTQAQYQEHGSNWALRHFQS